MIQKSYENTIPKCYFHNINLSVFFYSLHGSTTFRTINLKFYILLSGTNYIYLYTRINYMQQVNVYKNQILNFCLWVH